jgi:flagellar basal-body rod protein FlgF
MDVGLNIAASGMLAEQVQSDQLANDLANASTPGYKPDATIQSDFGALLLSNTSTGQSIGTIYTGVTNSKSITDMAQGALQETGEPLDFAITGNGFFGVQTSSGIQYTRDGQFATNSQGQLVDSYGDLVLSQSGGPIQVGAKDTVPTAALGVFDVPNATKLGNNNFSGTSTGRATGTVESGALEGSGVDAIRTITDMTADLEAYQAGQQAIQTINQTMQESSTSVGSLSGMG